MLRKRRKTKALADADLTLSQPVHHIFGATHIPNPCSKKYLKRGSTPGCTDYHCAKMEPNLQKLCYWLLRSPAVRTRVGK